MSISLVKLSCGREDFWFLSFTIWEYCLPYPVSFTLLTRLTVTSGMVPSVTDSGAFPLVPLLQLRLNPLKAPWEQVVSMVDSFSLCSWIHTSRTPLNLHLFSKHNICFYLGIFNQRCFVISVGFYLTTHNTVLSKSKTSSYCSYYILSTIRDV